MPFFILKPKILITLFFIKKTDLSKAYDCLSHDLLIAKLEAYGLDLVSPNFLLDTLV